MTNKDVSIFIVDDDESILRSLRRLIRSEGYRKIETFASAEAFLRDARIVSPCILVLDLLLPKMSGIGLFLHLQKTGSAIDTIFISALERELETARNECPEAKAFLRKPIDIGNLLTVINSISGA